MFYLGVNGSCSLFNVIDTMLGLTMWMSDVSGNPYLFVVGISCFTLCFVVVGSIKHEYKEWDEKTPQVTTCNANTKNLAQGSTVPQEVDAKREVVFTYDVTFKVLHSNCFVD